RPDRRSLPRDGEAGGQVLDRPDGVPHGDGGARHRAPDDADRPAVRRRDRVPARRVRARVPEGGAGGTAAARAVAPADRADRRERLRDAVDGAAAAFEQSAAAKQLDDSFHLAYRLLSSPKARAAFAVDREPDTVRDAYGRTRFGQSCLMARRLVEAGVRF